MNIEPGKMYTLPLVQITNDACVFQYEESDISMPLGFMVSPLKKGADYEVFVYKNAEGELTCTLKKPLVMPGGFGYLKVLDVVSYGAFLNWGIEKDLLLPNSEQERKVKPNQNVLVCVYLDPKNQRVVASSRIERFVSLSPEGISQGDEADVLIGRSSMLGYEAIVNNRYKGMIYNNQIFQPIRPGQQIRAWVSKVRPDGLIDIILQKPGYGEVENAIESILQALNESYGFIALNDQSRPEDIYRILGMSKKVFKKAVGFLYKQKQIVFEGDGIRLVDKD